MLIRRLCGPTVWPDVRRPSGLGKLGRPLTISGSRCWLNVLEPPVGGSPLEHIMRRTTP